MSKYLVRKTPSGKPKRNGWMGSSGSSSGNDFKLKSEGSSHISSGKNCSGTAQAQHSRGIEEEGCDQMSFRCVSSGVHV